MKHLSLIIRDYDHFRTNMKEFDLAKSYAMINDERVGFDRIRHVENSAEGSGLFLDGKNIFPGAVLHCHVDLGLLKEV